MKAVLQRVTEASVRVDGEVIGSIGKGFFILLGVSDEDDEAVADKMADKICKLRIFEDENGKTNLSLKERGRRGAGGESVHPVCRLPEGKPSQLHRSGSAGRGRPAL